MPPLLSITDVPIAGYPQGVSFTVDAGSLAVVLTYGQEANDCIVRLLLGLIKAARGDVSLFEVPLHSTTQRQIFQLRTRIGVVYPNGGLIANLTAWENLVLPLEYRGDLSADEISLRAESVLLRLGYIGSVTAPSGTLSMYQRRLLGLGRAMLGDPDLMLLNGILDGLGDSECQNLLALITAFHLEKQERITLYCTANLEIATTCGATQIIRLRGK
ncbi:MAG TPA: ATP-binding cassette domain-containing protein [Desulfuromonadales bacterium]|nr:ATP-binding cassette domain-containing protein [Desulfuromonadales bacterium]